MGTDQSTNTGEQSTTAERILDCAQERLQRRGYNAVSYGTLADNLDLTTAAIHYHFPSKADLVQTLVQRYRRTNAQKRARLCQQYERLRDRLLHYVELYSNIMYGGGFCLCGILAADEETLPPEVQNEVRQFFKEQEDWLTEILDDGTQNGGGLSGCTAPRDEARVFLAAVEGGMLTTPDRDPEAYTETLHCLVDSIVT